MSPAHPTVKLKNPFIAALLAWLVPGAGHVYQGRFGKGILYAACILGLFFSGWAFGGQRVCYFRWDKTEWRAQYLAQGMVGAAALPALLDRFDLRTGFAKLFPPLATYLAMPLEPAELNDLCFRSNIDAPAGLDFAAQEAACQALRAGPAPWAVSRIEVDELHRQRGKLIDIALVYTMVAGLLNILAIYDAACGPAEPEDDSAAPTGGTP